MKTAKITKLQVSDWYGKKFTSSAHLVELCNNKAITRVLLGRNEGFNWWSETYNYLTHDGRLIARITHNSDFGPSTQAYGIEVMVTSLVSETKASIRSKVWLSDFKILQGTCSLRRIAMGKTIQEYYFN